MCTLTTPPQLLPISFDSNLYGYLGVEIEAFVTKNGNIVPGAANIIALANYSRNPLYTKRGFPPPIKEEFSACQVEMAYPPYQRRGNLTRRLSGELRNLRRIAVTCGYELSFTPLAPPDMPLTVSQTAYYLNLAAQLNTNQILAACRVAGTHLHIGMPSLEAAVAFHDACVDQYEQLIAMAHAAHPDNAARLETYATVAPNCTPISFGGVANFTEWVHRHGMPRHKLIQITDKGTVELRFFPSTDNVTTICNWADAIWALFDTVAHDL